FPRALARDEWIQRRLKNAQPDPECGREPQRGCDLQPRVGRFGYPGVRDSLNPNRKAVAPILIRRGNGATALRLRIEQGCLAQQKVEILIHTRLQPGDRKSSE